MRCAGAPLRGATDPRAAQTTGARERARCDQGKKCVVIGGAGFLGGHVVEQLEAVGAQTVIFDIRPVQRASKLTTSVVGDICSFQARPCRGRATPPCGPHVDAARPTRGARVRRGPQDVVGALEGAHVVFLMASPPPELDDRCAMRAVARRRGTDAHRAAPR